MQHFNLPYKLQFNVCVRCYLNLSCSLMYVLCVISIFLEAKDNSYLYIIIDPAVNIMCYVFVIYIFSAY